MAKSYIADGALFKDAPVNDGKTHPVMHIALTVCGVNLNLAVWNKETSKNGTAYWPITGDYSRNETKRLVDVTPVIGSAQSGQNAQTPSSSPAEEDKSDLPF